METFYEIKNIDQLKAICDELRLSIIKALRQEPMTASQVAARLGENPNKLYYHFAELERFGLIRLVETRAKGNVLEKYFEAVAKYFTFANNEIFHTDEVEGPAAFYALANSIFNFSLAHLGAAIEAGRFTVADIDEAVPEFTRVRLSPEQAQSFQQRLNAIADELKAADSPDGQVPVALTMLLYSLHG